MLVWASLAPPSTFDSKIKEKPSAQAGGFFVTRNNETKTFQKK